MNLAFLSELAGKKNLLAFSHGTDSTALFYALLNECEFDLCLVNYHTRISSDLEEKSAVELARKYGKKIFIKHAYLNAANFEKNAREFRFNFFDELMQNYDNLIIAHNLNDKFEWFLMQLGKGAGLCNLLGFSGVDKRKNYQIIRPLINTAKDEIMAFLEQNKFQFFQDESNFSSLHKRNKIRKNYANDFIKEYASGVKKSFEFLQNDLINLGGKIAEFQGILLANDENSLDKAIKKKGFLLSFAMRKELLRQLKSGQKGQIFSKNKRLEIAKIDEVFAVFENCTCKLDKKQKAEFAKNNIPLNLRFFLAKNEINLDEFLHFLHNFNAL